MEKKIDAIRMIERGEIQLPFIMGSNRAMLSLRRSLTRFFRGGI